MTFLHNFHTRYGTHPDFHSRGKTAISMEVKQPGCEYDYTPVWSAKVKKSGAAPLFLPVHLHDMGRNNFTFI
jgi:hypothetical protein